MIIPMNFTVAASKQFKSKEGKSFVKLSGSALGFGIFQFIVPEERIPDHLEGKTVKARFKVYVGQDFSLRIGFDGIDGYVQE